MGCRCKSGWYSGCRLVSDGVILRFADKFARILWVTRPAFTVEYALSSLDTLVVSHTRRAPIHNSKLTNTQAAPAHRNVDDVPAQK